jgi:hypothetical protein
MRPQGPDHYSSCEFCLKRLYNDIVKINSLLVISPLLALYFFRPWSAAATAENDNQVEAEKLLQQAEELTDIRSSGSHEFRLAARVTLFDEKGQTREGTYDLLWKSQTAWQDELRFADFSQVRSAHVDKLFVSRKTPRLTLEAFQLLKLLDFPNLLRFSSEAKAQKLRERTRNGSRERTLEIALPGRSSWKIISLDVSSPIPIRVEFKGSHIGYQFENYVAFNGHQFPRTLIEFDSSKPLIQVQIQELTEATLDVSSLLPPQDARWLRWCAHPEPARRSDLDPFKVTPIPGPLRGGALEHPVAIYGVIGIDGQWHNLAVVKSAGKEVDSYWINEMLQEHFSPAKCGDVPVEQESVREFHLP